MRPDTLGVIGLGAMGGSLAWQAVQAGVRRVLGYATSPADVTAALRVGALTEAATSARYVIRHADLLVLATPPAATLRLLPEVAAALGAGAFCTDLVSVKRPVVDAARAAGVATRFAGSHPLVGALGTGFGAADSQTFVGAVVYVTPTEDGDTAAREVSDFWQSVCGAHSVLAEADTHDAVVGWTGHLPQLVAAALAETLGGRGPRGASVSRMALETSRWAMVDVALWRDHLLLNRTAVLKAMDGLEESLGALRQSLAGGDADGVSAWLERAATWRVQIER